MPKDIAAKSEKARARIARALISELDVDPEVADLAADSCVRLVHHPSQPSLAQRARRRLGPVLRPIVAAVAIAVATAGYGGKVLFYDHAQWFNRYPRTYARLDGWRPVPRDYDWSSWSELLNSESGQCMIKQSRRTCLDNLAIPRINAALSAAVHDQQQGVIWHGPNGSGEIWTIEHKDGRFVIRAEDDPDFHNDGQE
jgi:hypothetical protein